MSLMFLVFTMIFSPQPFHALPLILPLTPILIPQPKPLLLLSQVSLAIAVGVECIDIYAGREVADKFKSLFSVSVAIIGAAIIIR